MKHKQIEKDHGKDLAQTVVTLLGLLTALWYLNL